MSVKFGNWQRLLDRETSIVQSFSLLLNVDDLAKAVSTLKENGIIRKYDWVTNYFKETKRTKGNRGKCNKKAEIFRREGNQFFKKKQYSQALSCYNNCILHAEQTSKGFGKELSLGYANRSAVLFHLKKYHECTTDVNASISSGYPEDLVCKVYLRKAQCYVELANKELAGKAIENAKKSLRYIDKTKQDCTAKDISKVEKEIASRSDDIKTCLKRDIPTPVRGSNPVVVQASNSLELKHSPDQGRHLMAKECIKAGDILIVEKPFAAVLLPPHYSTYCHHCFVKLTVCYPCINCIEVWYCSESCRAESWRIYHCVECPYLDLLHSIGIAHLSLRVVLSAGLHQLLEFKPTLSDVTDGIPGVTKQGKYERNYLSVYALMPHSRDMVPEDLFQYTLTANLLLDLLENSDYFSNLLQNDLTIDDQISCHSKTDESNQVFIDNIDNRDLEELSTISMNKAACDIKTEETNCIKEGSSPNSQHSNAIHNRIMDNCREENYKSEEMARKIDTLHLGVDSLHDVKLYIGGLLLRHICQLVCNAHAITELQLSQVDNLSLVSTQTQERIATAIYPTTSLLNHSCQPTIINSFIKDRLVVRAVRNIQPGEQVYNCYGPHAQRMSFRERQCSLKSQYFFTCQCPACLTEGENESIYEAFKCPQCCGPMVNEENTACAKDSLSKEDIDKRTMNTYNCVECSFQTQGHDNMKNVLHANEMFSKAICLMEMGSTKECLDMLLQVVKLQDDILYKHNRVRAETHDAIAKCLVQLGNYYDAVPHLGQSLDTTCYIYGKTSIEYASELQKYAEVLLHARRKIQCIQATEEAIQLFELHYGKDDDNIKELENILCIAKYSLR